ncbi:glycosyltransferase family 2 protein [Paracoccus zeaxanthinifaciens]|uniref:glycosyltransferase family 2 protein n=1 Tax=Paracoccus zeaxanthinifaciens TaxID=187400 RepID=UPI000686AC05|nr:glycosyltransferase family 2 protein [Paracoccus zeaxanthinifaciens]
MTTPGPLQGAWQAYRLRWKRRELIWRAIRARRRLRPIAIKMGDLAPDAIIAVSTLRNEMAHLPEFLDHHRALGVDHFLVVDNDSDDGTVDYLRAQPDVSVWGCSDSYRAARFGLDWANALLMRHGGGRWCLTLDADELLVFPDHDRRGLRQLTAHLDARGVRGMGAVMLDLYPTGALGTEDAAPDAPLTARLPWFDAAPWRSRRMMPRRNLWLQGGVRDRAFFADDPRRAPTMNKLPLMRWNWRQVYVNSTHSMLPPHLNMLYDGPGDARLSGVLLHAKFTADITAKSAEELSRRQHFADPDLYAPYHRAIVAGPVLRNADSRRYEGWRQLVDLGLMGTGDWLER